MRLKERPGRWPQFDRDEIDAAVAVLESGRINQWTGEEVASFEREYARSTGRRHAIALANGTVAIELALIGLGIGPGDDVVVTPRSFIASASPVVLRGARPVFADVDRDSGNLTAESIAKVLTPRTRAVIAVHLAGWPCDMDEIAALARKRGLHVIEDCAQAHGATWRGRPVGSFGIVGCFSFCQDKILTTAGEGGLVVTDDRRLYERMWAYKDHGKSFEACFRRSHPPGFRWLHESFGTNWRMTEVQAAVGRVGLRKLGARVRLRRRNAAILESAFREHAALRVPVPPVAAGHAYYKYHVYVRPERLRRGWSRDRIAEAIGRTGVPVFSGSCSEMYREKAFTRAGLAPASRLPVARELGETSLMFLVHPTAGAAEMKAVVERVMAVMDRASRT